MNNTPGPDSAVSGGGLCDGGCGSAEMVVTLANPLPPGEDGSRGVVITGGGAVGLDLDRAAANMPPLIWIANSGEGTISKIDTRTMKELARYRTGPVTGPGTPDPSRTTVSLSGDVVVANRAGGSATRIASDASRCVDRDHDGRIDTSGGADDVKPWGADECVLWNIDLGGASLPRAAAFDAQVGIDGGDASKVWIGLYNVAQMVKLDPADGRVLAAVDVSPVTPYGAAVDHAGQVWVWGGGAVARIDTANKVTHVPDPPCGYGIAVGRDGSVWTSGASCVARYLPGSSQWESVKVGIDNRGLALDGRGSVWVADTDYGVHQLDEQTMQVKKDMFLAWSTFVGIAIDADRRVWAIARGSSTAVRIDPAAGYAVTSMKTGDSPYTYSDMTGFQLRNAAAPSGRWRHVFDGCQERTHFASLEVAATLPPGTAIDLSARTADSRQELGAAPWVRIATLPPQAGPIALDGPLGSAATASFLELEAALRTVSPVTGPTLDKVELTMECVPMIQ